MIEWLNEIIDTKVIAWISDLLKDWMDEWHELIHEVMKAWKAERNTWMNRLLNNEYGLK